MMKSLLTTFRTVIGDITTPSFRDGIEGTSGYSNYIWITWIVLVWIGNIIITNLLIAI